MTGSGRGPARGARRRSARGSPRTGGLVAGLTQALAAAACSSTAQGPTARPTTTTVPAGGTATTSSAPVTSAPTTATGLPPVRHVFVIVLENEGYASTFRTPSDDPYLAGTLVAQGALLTNYYGIGHHSADNYIAMISGQAPNPLTQSDCQTFADFPAAATIGADGQITDSGCVYPTSVTTVADQLDAAHLTWKAYMQDMGNVPTRESAVCGHPAVGAPDHTEAAVAGDGYASRHDPFVYFHYIIDDTARCNSDVVPLGTATGALPAGTPSGTTGLAADLGSVATTPNLSFITPNLCNDGHDAPCVNQSGSASPFVNVDAFLQTWVPLITASPAFKKDGLLEVTFDEADTSGSGADASACCNEVAGPAASEPGEFGPGGGRVGTVLVSPFIRPGTVTSVPYNHYSTLATIEGLFGLARLGGARTVTARFGTDVFTNPAG